jgi:zinc D-Ala-D-Ala carboxypeptidase
VTRRVILDVSNHQADPIDFARIKREHPEVVGVIVKASEGLTFVDPMFAVHVDAAANAGLLTGCYTFVRPQNVGILDMQRFLDVVGLRPMPLGYWLDVEADDGVDPATLLARVVEKAKYVDGLASRPGRFLHRSLVLESEDEGLRSSPRRAVPAVAVRLLATMPTPPTPWTSPLLWQFTDAYETHIGAVDASVWLGTDAQWDAWTGKPKPPPKPTPGGGMNAHDIQQSLVNIGWPLRVDGNLGPLSQQAIRDFQVSWNGSSWLAVDGYAGPQTQQALFLAVWTGGLLSPHFRAREFACKHCGWIKTHRVLLAGLERIRPAGGLSVVSGYRCPTHNRDIGGATNSQHIYGTAADIPPIYTLSQVRNMRLFSGIEYRRDGRVYHVDVRADGPNNTTGSSNSNPSVFLWG